MKARYFSSFCLLFALVLCKDYPHLNVPQVLLPYTPSGSSSASFVIQGLQNGCYFWTSSNPEVIPVMPIFSGPSSQARGCSNSAIVTTTSVGPTRQSALILAEDISGEILQSNVAVDKIVRIEIMSTSRLLLLGQAPAIYYVKAYDKIGNVFSNVSGFAVDWFLSNAPNSNIDANNVLRIMPGREQARNCDCNGVCTQISPNTVANSVLAEGINTGSAMLCARLADLTFKNILPSRLRIQVIDNVMLVPSDDIYILVGARVRFQVFRLIQEQQREVKFPSELYAFDVSNKSIIDMKEIESVITAKNIGDSVVSLVDKNIQQSQIDYRPNCEVHVVEPAYLGFTVLPDRVWVLESGRQYTVIIDLYDRDSNRIQISEGTVIKSAFPKDYFLVHYSTSNGSYHQIQAIKAGNVTITASLSQIWLAADKKHLNLKQAVIGDQDVNIFKPISLQPPILVFPWTTVGQLDCSYKLRINGGSGSYYWSTSQANVATVNTKGLVKARNFGQTTIKAIDIRNSNHFSTAEVYVSYPYGMKFVSPPVETAAGESLTLDLRMWTTVDDGRTLNFLLCDNFPIDIMSSDLNIFTVDETRKPGNFNDSCLAIVIHCINPGSARLHASYTDAGSVSLTAEEIVTCFDPLQVVDPSGIAIVSLYSSVTITSIGGPKPRSFDRSSYFESVIPAEPDQVSLELLSPSDMPTRLSLATDNIHVHRVTCTQLGEQILTISVGNRKSLGFPFSVSSSVTFRFMCTIPDALKMEPVLTLLPDFDVIPCYQWLEEKVLKHPVRNDQSFPIRLSMIDANGRYFNNFSSIQLTWHSKNQELASMADVSDYEWINNHTSELRLVRTAATEGSVIIQSSINGYKVNIQPKQKSLPPLSVSLILQLISPPRISPAALNIFNHHNITEQLSIIHGSGHFRIEGSHANINVTRISSSKLRIIPLREGTTSLFVRDLCLDTDTTPAKATMRVLRLSSIEVHVIDLIEMGSETTAYAKLIDSSGFPLPSRYLNLVKLSARSSSKNLEITLVEVTKSDSGDTAVYKLRGLSVGYATVVWSGESSAIGPPLSVSREIYVFPPMSVFPTSLVLVPSAEIQISCYGGPPTQAQVLFHSLTNDIAVVDSKGLVQAKNIGRTLIEVVMQAVDASTGKVRTYSKTSVPVTVTRLTGVKIFASTNRLVTGSTMSVYAVGLTDETPISFGSAMPRIKFNWISSNDEVITISSIYSNSGINYEDESDFAVRVTSKSAGESHVTLTVDQTETSISRYFEIGAVLSAEQKFEVSKALQVIYPVSCQLRLPYRSETQLKTNLDGLAKLTFSISGKTSVATIDDQRRITTGSDAGRVTIFASSVDKLGLNQTVAINLEVKPVVAISIESLSTLRVTTTNQTHKFPIGATIKFRVNLLDSSGQRLDDVAYKLEYQLNRFDIVHISRETNSNVYTIKTISPGQVIWHVWDQSSTSISDHIRITVDHAVVPRSLSILSGFSTYIKTALTKHPTGVWSSDESNIVEVDSNSGIITALKAGSAVIYYNVKGLLSLSCDVVVNRIAKVSLHSGSQKFVTNVYDGMQFTKQPVHYVSKVTFASSGNELNAFSGHLVESRASKLFSCNLRLKDGYRDFDADDIFDVESIVNTSRSLTYCQINPRRTDRSLASSVSTIDNVILELTASTTNLDRNPTIESEVETVRFIPAFVISKLSIILTDSHKSDSLTVFGIPLQLKNLEFTADPFLSVRGTASSENECIYEISLLKNIDTSVDNQMQITVSVVYKSPEKALVSSPMKLDESACSEFCRKQSMVQESLKADKYLWYTDTLLIWTRPFYSLLSLWTFILALVVVFYIMCIGWSNRRYQSSVSRLNPRMDSSNSPQSLHHSGIASPFRYTVGGSSPRLRYVANSPNE
ncbi:uncharacterized protein TRIADDRAFT_51962 [Trichoplax adhaerens]|uniref:BIG2 domain-containing protein n=1 Tax=Trichoplax adhaerens TaxID=10228 RepID=B3RLC9_TRIAD|nr:hypothetical protein TRIADDRAFT_51962 [Trichoplax adhaerens]EDV28745.1 hypothetical protein TRIADDRAFT_51962 [Trichoplax adhaerens]|eukprot:XP_002107947.1 hypothetical protein TRIADDRAFT_51962 [Trichoplax adhaerens]